MKHNHHSDGSLLVKFVRRGQKMEVEARKIEPLTFHFPKAEAISICMESPFYFCCPTYERKAIINRLSS